MIPAPALGSPCRLILLSWSVIGTRIIDSAAAFAFAAPRLVTQSQVNRQPVSLCIRMPAATALVGSWCAAVGAVSSCVRTEEASGRAIAWIHTLLCNARCSRPPQSTSPGVSARAASEAAAVQAFSNAIAGVAAVAGVAGARRRQGLCNQVRIGRDEVFPGALVVTTGVERCGRTDNLHDGADLREDPADGLHIKAAQRVEIGVPEGAAAGSRAMERRGARPGGCPPTQPPAFPLSAEGVVAGSILLSGHLLMSSSSSSSSP